MMAVSAAMLVATGLAMNSGSLQSPEFSATAEVAEMTAYAGSHPGSWVALQVARLLSIGLTYSGLVVIAIALFKSARNWALVGIAALVGAIAVLSLDVYLVAGLAAGSDSASARVSSELVTNESSVAATTFDHLSARLATFGVAVVAMTLAVTRALRRVGLMVGLVAFLAFLAEQLVIAIPAFGLILSMPLAIGLLTPVRVSQWLDRAVVGRLFAPPASPPAVVKRQPPRNVVFTFVGLLLSPPVWLLTGNVRLVFAALAVGPYVGGISLAGAIVNWRRGHRQWAGVTFGLLVIGVLLWTVGLVVILLLDKMPRDTGPA